MTLTRENPIFWKVTPIFTGNNALQSTVHGEDHFYLQIYWRFFSLKNRYRYLKFQNFPHFRCNISSYLTHKLNKTGRYVSSLPSNNSSSFTHCSFYYYQLSQFSYSSSCYLIYFSFPDYYYFLLA